MASAIAEAAIGKLIDTLSEMIVKQIAEEAALVRNFTEDFEWLQEKLTTISGCLTYADSRAAQDEPVKRWLHRVGDVAWDAEDIVEECAVRPLYTRCATQSCVCNPHELLFSYRMGKRIKEVKERINSIMVDGEQLMLFRVLVPLQAENPSSSAAGGAVWKGNSVMTSDSHPVAIEPKIQHLISMIDQSTAPVIAVVAMGGAGKTFLLQNVFDRIKKRYDHSIWLSISQSYFIHKLQGVLASYMGNLKDAIKDLMEERAAEMIHGRLKEANSLIVLDDVWRAARESNIIERLGLPIGLESKCKVVVTTRNRGVGQNLHACIYEMEVLSKEESWQLFCAHAFGGDLPPSHLHLKKIASEVEKQCGKLPLALKITGASLSGCTEISQWNSKLSQLKEVVDLNKDPVIQILRLSYDSLPAALKPCFSYLSSFPEDEEIPGEYVISLWIAEGFIPQGEDQWDVAWGYLYQLANLCLLEVWEIEGLIKYCKIHDLLLDLAIDISKENRCAFAVEADAFPAVKRILLAKKEIDDMVIARSNASCPRSLRTLSLNKNPIEKIEENFISPMRLLRVLDLRETKISTLPACVGKLKLLKLLNLSETNIAEVPICVKSLKSLVLLDLSACEQLKRVPQWISQLKCLQHLNIDGCHDELRNHMPKGLSELVSLRLLRSRDLRLSVEEDGLLKLEDVAKLTRLQELWLTVKHEKELKSIEDGILAQLLKMRLLSITSDFSTDSHLPQNITALPDLQKLSVVKFAVPNWVWLPNLRELGLWHCRRSNYPELETMPNLVRLRLVGNESCREVPKAFGKSSGFPKLRFLRLSNFPLLEEELPDLEDGAMAVLEAFSVRDCPRVKKGLEGLERLTRLRGFNYSRTGTHEFREKLSSREVWNKIKAKNLHLVMKGTMVSNLLFSYLVIYDFKIVQS